MKNTIKQIKARQILDSRGTPTIEVEVFLNNGIMSRASIPSGASTGKKEACELRDGNNDYYFGKSVLKAVNNVNNIISPALIGYDVTKQEEIDQLLINLDGTKNKSKLGANAILGTSLAVCKAAAKSLDLELFEYLNPNGNTLPTPMMNIINGGQHADNNLNIQEFMIVPISANTWSQALQMCAEIFHALKMTLKQNNYPTVVGDEGGFAPNFKNDEEALEFIVKAINSTKYEAGKDIKIALDIASNAMYEKAEELNEKGKYYFWKTKQMFSVDELIAYYDKLIKKFPIISIEDPFDEEDWNAWNKFTKQYGKTIQIVGDDIYVTNHELLERGIKEQSSNAILIKLNQIGTVTETLNTIKTAQENGFNCVISHRSGETEDTYIADFAVATNIGQIKTGAPSRIDRVAKYNQLLRIEEKLDKKAKFLGEKAI